jgi:outer membrane protein TolC
MRLSFYYTPLLLIWLLKGLSTQAQTRLQSTDEAIELAKRNNLDLQIARQTTQIQSWNLTAAKGARLPQVRFTTVLDYNFLLPTQLIPAQFFGGKEGEFRTIQFGVPFNLTAGIESTMPLWNVGLKQDVNIAQANQKVVDLQALVLQDDLSTQVARLYLATVFTQEYLRITQQNLANADSIARIAWVRKDKGLIDQLEYNRVRSTRLAVEDALRQNEMAYQKNLNQLRLVVGDSTARTSPPAPLQKMERGEITPFPKWVGPSHERTGDGVPRLQLRMAQLELAQQQLTKEQKLKLPTLSVYARLSEQAQRNKFNFLNFNEPWFGIGVAGLRLEVPIYTARIRESGIARARINAEIAQRQLENEQRKFDTETQDLRIGYHQAARSLQVNQEAYQLSEENLQLALIKYKGGVMSYDQYLNVFNEALNAQNKYFRTLADVMINDKLLELRR